MLWGSKYTNPEGRISGLVSSASVFFVVFFFKKVLDYDKQVTHGWDTMRDPRLYSVLD